MDTYRLNRSIEVPFWGKQLIPLSCSLWAVLFALLLAGSLGCTRSDENNPSATDTTETIPFDHEGNLAFIQDGDSTVTVEIEIAETDSSRERGMMEREGFPSDTSGMLFVFDDERHRRFWMANTPVALDLFFINADSQVVSLSKYASPNSPDGIRSGYPAQYVLETPAGFADQYGIVEGDRVRWRRLE